MKNMFKLFCGDDYYPLGGYADLKGFFETIESAKEFVEKEFEDETSKWAQIVFDEKIIIEGKKDSIEPIRWDWEYAER